MRLVAVSTLLYLCNFVSVSEALVPPDPGLFDLGVAVASAAAGVASQAPRISALEKELEQAQSALLESHACVFINFTVGRRNENKDQTLEEKLFLMDEEFEGQAARMKKQFDVLLRDELGKLTKKLKEDYEYAAEIKIQEQRKLMLTEKLDFVNGLNGNKEAELVDLRLRRGQMEEANKKLEQALKQSETELEALQSRTKKGWWPF